MARLKAIALAQSNQLAPASSVRGGFPDSRQLPHTDRCGPLRCAWSTHQDALPTANPRPSDDEQTSSRAQQLRASGGHRLQYTGTQSA